MSEFAFTLPGETGRFTASERALLALLHKGQGRPVRHIALFDALYSTRPECDGASPETIKVFISNIRRKLKAHRIDAVWGAGYRMVKIEKAARIHFRPVAA